MKQWILCIRCSQKIYEDDFAKSANTCVKSRCGIKKPIARQTIAKLTNKSVDDFVVVDSGHLNVHSEQYKPHIYP